MTELHITDPNPFEDDLFNEKSLRPFKLEDFIGQNELVDSLSLYIKAATMLRNMQGGSSGVVMIQS